MQVLAGEALVNFQQEQVRYPEFLIEECPVALRGTNSLRHFPRFGL
jgi:hypothetical protein